MSCHKLLLQSFVEIIILQSLCMCVCVCVFGTQIRREFLIKDFVSLRYIFIIYETRGISYFSREIETRWKERGREKERERKRKISRRLLTFYNSKNGYYLRVHLGFSSISVTRDKITRRKKSLSWQQSANALQIYTLLKN